MPRPDVCRRHETENEFRVVRSQQGNAAAQRGVQNNSFTVKWKDVSTYSSLHAAPH